MAWYHVARQNKRQRLLLEKAIAAAPGPGDEFDVAAVFPVKADRRIAVLEMDYFKEFHFERRGRGGRTFAVRRGLKLSEAEEKKSSRANTVSDSGCAAAASGAPAPDAARAKLQGRLVERGKRARIFPDAGAEGRVAVSVGFGLEGLRLIRRALRLPRLGPRVYAVERMLLSDQTVADVAGEFGLGAARVRADLAAGRRALKKLGPGGVAGLIERG